jgi:hypothetical protein
MLTKDVTEVHAFDNNHFQWFAHLESAGLSAP